MSQPYVAEGSVSITPSDSKDLDYPGVCLFVGSGGSIHIIGMNGQEDTISLSAHTLYPVRVKKVFATGTTATNIHGLMG